MAPEQFAAASVDARTDQFAFCVMLWEGVYGQRPFEGDQLMALAANVVEGRRRPPPRGVVVPRWLRRVLERGLAVASDERWPSIAVMLSALDRYRRRAWLSRLFAGLGVGAVVAAGAVGWQQLDRIQRIAACERSGAEVDDLWNDGERTAVRAGLMATGVGHASTTADKVITRLDAQAETWRGARTEGCVDTDVHGRWEPTVRDRSVACLDERLLELGALVDRLRDADAITATNAVKAAAGLKPVAACRDETLLSLLLPRPAGSDDAIHAVRAELSRAAALQATGAYVKGLAVAEPTLEQAEATGWTPLMVAARTRVGKLLAVTGEYAKAEGVLEEAYFEAAGSGLSVEALEAAEALMRLMVQLDRHSDAERWSKHGDLLRSTLPDPLSVHKSIHLTSLGSLRFAQGRYEEAAAFDAEALEVLEETFDGANPEVAGAMANLANARYVMGDYEAAGTLYERAMTLFEEALGPSHPDVAGCLVNLANLRATMGAYEGAVTLLRRALPIYKESQGARHPNVANVLSALGEVRWRTGRYEQAAALHAEALSIREDALGSDHPEVAQSLGNLALVRGDMGAYEEAAELQSRALEIFERVLGPDHRDVAQSLENLANLRSAYGANDEAEKLHTRALSIRERALGPDHADVARSLNNLAAIREKTGRGRKR